MSKNEGQVDGFMGELTFAKHFYEHNLWDKTGQVSSLQLQVASPPRISVMMKDKLTDFGGSQLSKTTLYTLL